HGGLAVVRSCFEKAKDLGRNKIMIRNVEEVKF
ncbi:unnamed protein product, partial [marine sediment metagenome]